VKESEPAPAAPLSKKAKKKAKDKAAKAAAAKAPEEAKKVTKNDINNLLSKSKPAEEAAPAPAAGKKKKKKNKGAAVAAAAPVEAAPAYVPQTSSHYLSPNGPLPFFPSCLCLAHEDFRWELKPPSGELILQLSLADF
jgi:hypothetical protein